MTSHTPPKLAARSPITVRGFETPEELHWICRLSAATFGEREEGEDAVNRFLRRTVESPDYRPGQWRGAFQDGEPLGGYIMFEREMHAGAARLRTGCIGAVVTHPDARMGGVGRALMEDAIGYACRRGYALLLLDGIPDFYQRFGYVDVFDLTEHHLARAAIEALPPSPYRVRPVAEHDAAAVLSLYERQYGRYTGSFDRDLATQRHRLREELEPHPMVITLDEHDTPRGYLAMRREEPARATEVTAENPLATVALLHEHVRLAGAVGTPMETLHWPLPLDSPILTWLIDNLALPDTSRREHVTTLWSVESRTYHHPNAGWVARPAAIESLLDSLLPAWRERWSASARPWYGRLTLQVEGVSRNLMLDEGVRFGAASGERVVLTAGSLVQLVFGYRDVDYVAGREGEDVPGELVPVLRILFPLGQAWIPGSDAF